MGISALLAGYFTLFLAFVLAVGVTARVLANENPDTIAYPWLPDQRDGTYRNPIICADYSDPDVVRDGDDFYLVASSFNCTPGLPILHSRDLVNWRIVNHAVRNLPDPRGVFHQPRHGEGIWAPAIRKHNGKFWIFFPMPDEGIYVITADHPTGKWSEPHLLLEGKGLIDPCPLWDDDGQAYLVHAYARSRAGIKDILRVRPMSPDGRTILGEGQIVYSDPERHPTLEGPKFHKKDGWYIISAPAGGVKQGWQLILRSRNVYGPYDEKIVLEQGKTLINGPHQGAIVDLDTESWFVHFQDAGPYGRIVHLQPVRWQYGWPLMGIDYDGDGVGEPVLRHAKPKVGAKDVEILAPQTSDEFDSETLGLQWQWHANHREDWADLTERKGWLRLMSVQAAQELENVPNLLLQKLPARQFAAETLLELTSEAPAAEAGLIVMGKSHAALVLRRDADHAELRMIVNNVAVATTPLASPRVRLRVRVTDTARCQFAYAEDEESFKPIGSPFRATEGRWIGAKVGLFCRTRAGSKPGHADFDYFRFSAP